MFRISLIIIIAILFFSCKDSDVNKPTDFSQSLGSCSNPYDSIGNQHNIIIDDVIYYINNNHELWHEDTVWVGDTLFYRKDMINKLLDQIVISCNSNNIDTNGFYVYENHIETELISQNLIRTINSKQYIPALYHGFDSEYANVFIKREYLGADDSLGLYQFYDYMYDGDYEDADNYLYLIDNCSLDSVLDESTLKILAVYDSSYSYWTNVMGESPNSHGNYPAGKISKSFSFGKEAHILGRKEEAIQNASNAFDALIIVYDAGGGAMAGPFGAAAGSLFVLGMKIGAINDLQDCLCDQCGARLTKPGC